MLRYEGQKKHKISIYSLERLCSKRFRRGKVDFHNLFKITKKNQFLLTIPVEFDIIKRVIMMAVLWKCEYFRVFRQTSEVHNELHN